MQCFTISAHLSNAGTVSKWTHISSRYSGMNIILVFVTLTIVTKFQRTPLNRGIKYTGWGKFATLYRSRHLSQKWYGIGPWLWHITNRQSQVADRSVSVPMILSDLEKQDMRSPFSGGSPNVHSYYLTQNDQIRHGNTSRERAPCFWAVSHTPSKEGDAPASPNYLDILHAWWWYKKR